MNPTSRYLLLVGGLIFGFMGATALINWLVDPYDIYHVVNAAHVNANKPGSRGHDRMVKAYAIQERQPRGLIFGTSRIQYGINPDDAALQGHGGFYNAGLLNSDIYLVLRYLQHAQAIAPVKTVLVGLDPLMFDLDSGVARQDFFEERLAVTPEGTPTRSLFPVDFAPTLLSSDALYLSALTLARQAVITSDLLPNGQRAPAVLRQYFTEVRAVHEEVLFIEHEYLHDYRQARLVEPQGESKAQKTLGELVRFCAAHRIDLHLFITPSHARLNEVARAANFADDIETWKRDLVRTVNGAVATSKPQTVVDLWDFNATRRFVTEPVPAAGDKASEMQNWWESTHFRENVGHAMLQRMLNEKSGPHDFGVKLTAHNVEKEIARMRQLQQHYAATHAADVAEIDAAAARPPGKPLTSKFKAAL